MISFVRGKIAEITEHSVILDTGNMGYEIYMTGTALDHLSHTGDTVKLHTYFHVREDAMQLFGFLSRDDLNMFRLLLGVNGVGPKAALGILSGITPDELRFAVLSEDVKTISKAPGIGKKTAQKLILELKDKLKLEDAFELKLQHQQEELTGSAGTAGRDSYQEAVEALAALGYSNTDALRAVRQVTGVDEGDVEAILKAALKNM